MSFEQPEEKYELQEERNLGNLLIDVDWLRDETVRTDFSPEKLEAVYKSNAERIRSHYRELLEVTGLGIEVALFRNSSDADIEISLDDEEKFLSYIHGITSAESYRERGDISSLLLHFTERLSHRRYLKREKKLDPQETELLLSIIPIRKELETEFQRLDGGRKEKYEVSLIKDFEFLNELSKAAEFGYGTEFLSIWDILEEKEIIQWAMFPATPESFKKRLEEYVSRIDRLGENDKARDFRKSSINTLVARITAAIEWLEKNPNWSKDNSGYQVVLKNIREKLLTLPAD